MRYTVEVLRTVSVAVEVEADNPEAAYEKAAANPEEVPALVGNRSDGQLCEVDVLDSWEFVVYEVRPGGEWIEQYRRD